MLLRRLAFVLGLVWAAPAGAEPPVCDGVDLSSDPSIKPDWEGHADEMVNGEGLLWRIEKPGLAPSYLYGTMHSTGEGPMGLAKQAWPFAEKAKVVATELGDLDPTKKIELGAKMLQAAMAPDVDTFSGLIQGGDVPRVEAFLSEHGTAPEMAHHLKLWMLVITASLPKCEVEGQLQALPEVDDSFVKVAKAHEIPVVGLESMDEQMRLIASIPDSIAATGLRGMAAHPALKDGGFVTLLKFYQEKRPPAALAVLDAVPGVSEEERRASAEMLRLLLGNRNEIMAERAAPLLAAGDAFIAVGALHLSGKGGLVELFRARGYRVTKVW
jgi:uncharacterized protein YbaP (TraB family)